MTVSADTSSAFDLLTRRINYERTTTVPYESSEFKLDRMRRLLALLGDPHLAVKALHIAGTKGKGSTAVMAAAILQAAGYRTGLYTSPHLDRIEERIVVDGRMCPEEAFFKLCEQVQPAVEQLDREAESAGASGPTFFEVTTAMAFLHFANSQVDIAVLEVGLGGRLDSTNVCLSEVCVITTISFDHTKQLGSTLAAIAREKAGIIKPGVPVVSGVINPEPRDVILSRAEELGAPLFLRGRDFDFEPTSPLATHHAPLTETLCYREPASEPTFFLDDVRLNLIGRHQCANAATAIAAIRRLIQRGWSINEDHLRQGLAAAHCSARIEQVGRSPTVIIDVGHNVASIEAVAQTLQERFPADRRIAIFASSKDKDFRGMLQIVLSTFDVVILTQYLNNPRAQTVEELLAMGLQLRTIAKASAPLPKPVLHGCVRPEDAWKLARHIANPSDLICITGSFFLAAELRPIVAIP